MATQGISDGAPEEGTASRLMAFDRYLYDLFIAQTGALDHPTNASADGGSWKIEPACRPECDVSTDEAIGGPYEDIYLG